MTVVATGVWSAPAFAQSPVGGPPAAGEATRPASSASSLPRGWALKPESLPAEAANRPIQASAVRTTALPLAPRGTFKVGSRPPDRKAAARFLRQATFGPATRAEIDELMRIGYDAWFIQQFEAPKFDHLGFVAGAPANPAGTDVVATAFWTAATHGKDQLRARLVWALSQIFVVSGEGAAKSKLMSAYYWDLLAEQAFSDYRSLLDRLTYSNIMGQNLTFWFNSKEDPDTGAVPDQNYAREIMQLFSIGLWQLNLDGTRKMANGRAIPAYTQDDVVGLSRIFTGIVNYNIYGAKPPASVQYWDYGDDAYTAITPGAVWPGGRSQMEKKFLGVTIAPIKNWWDQTEQIGRDEIKLALDTVANHPNVGPFIGKQLIQRFVTSNPSPAYVKRVASVFNNNGHGKRGDLKAVIKAILLDPEARDPAKLADPTFGKIREPVLLATQLFRLLNAKAQDGGVWMISSWNVGCLVDYGIINTTGSQDPMQSPTVFNFYRPGFAPAGSAIEKAGLVAPEFQILDTQSVTRWSRFLYDTLRIGGVGRSDTKLNGCLYPYTKYDLSGLMNAAKEPQVLVDHLALLLSANSMSKARRKMIVDAVAQANGPGKADTWEFDNWGVPYVKASNPPSAADIQKSRIRVALSLMFTMPEVIVQQ